MSDARRTYSRNVLWNAALVHRVSGLALAIFLPLHFLVLGLAIEGAAKLDGFLRLTSMPSVKLAEAGLVFLLVVHFLGGLRLLLVENGPWLTSQKFIALAAGIVASVVAFLFLVEVL